MQGSSVGLRLTVMVQGQNSDHENIFKFPEYLESMKAHVEMGTVLQSKETIVIPSFKFKK